MCLPGYPCLFMGSDSQHSTTLNGDTWFLSLSWPHRSIGTLVTPARPQQVLRHISSLTTPETESLLQI